MNLKRYHNNIQSFWSMSLEKKLTLTFLLTSGIIFIVNIILFLNINRAVDRIDEVYESNVEITELATALDQVQSDLTDYLQTKSSEALRNYYRSAGEYQDKLSGIGAAQGSEHAEILRKNITAMSGVYVDLCEQATNAKRGRNVRQYKGDFADAAEMYGYLREYINSLNHLELQENAGSYDIIRQSYHSMELISMLVLMVMTMTNLVLTSLVVHAATRPLEDLSVQARTVSTGNFDVEALPIVSHDEIGVVTGTFNEMVVSIRGYIEKLRTSMELENRMKEQELLMDAHLKEAELKYLQAQINPHFLFNTLNAGAQLSMMEGADRTYRYLQNVASFFRTKTNRDNQVTTLAQEISLVDNYMYIINVRFSGSIAYEKNIDEDLIGIAVPSMILQPIVENAVNHGIRNIDWPARIVLSVYRTGDFITVSVKDNGCGMTQEQIGDLLAGTEKVRERGDETNGVGVANVVNRIRLFYSNEMKNAEITDVFDVTSAGENQGTEVLLYVPNFDRGR